MPITTPDAIRVLRNRYPQNKGQWATIVEFDVIDFLAVNCWPSRGFEVHGHEIKVSRSDWKRELKKPHKALLSMARCDFWWVAAPDGIVQPGELPEGWGLMILSDKGSRVAIQAPRLRDKIGRSWYKLSGEARTHGIDYEFVQRSSFAMMARRFAYAQADRDHIITEVTDPVPLLDEAARATGRITSTMRNAQKEYQAYVTRNRREQRERMKQYRMLQGED